MLTVVIARPPSTYTFTTSFAIYFNSRKTLFPVASCWKQQISCTFEVLELLLLVWCCCCWRERKEGAQVATTVAMRGNFCVTFKPTNRAGKQVSKPCLFSLCLALVLSLKLSTKKKKQKKQKFWPPAVVMSTSRRAIALFFAVAASLQQRRSAATTLALAS